MLCPKCKNGQIGGHYGLTLPDAPRDTSFKCDNCGFWKTADEITEPKYIGQYERDPVEKCLAGCEKWVKTEEDFKMWCQAFSRVGDAIYNGALIEIGTASQPASYKEFDKFIRKIILW